MARRQRIRCDCGGELHRPVPRKCPHCGAPITVRYNLLPVIMAALVIGGSFAILLWYVRHLSQSF